MLCPDCEDLKRMDDIRAQIKIIRRDIEGLRARILGIENYIAKDKKRRENAELKLLETCLCSEAKHVHKE